MIQWAGHNVHLLVCPLLWKGCLRLRKHQGMDSLAARLLSARAAEEEAEEIAFDDQLLEALSEGDTGTASPEVPKIRWLL